ncbi:MAG: tetratricopeptide repeat protein [Rhabdochlamydiaceae bacterium]|nr:tetratricopeptide repeat protein [Candidatus Amphrikana amoebophyrae]
MELHISIPSVNSYNQSQGINMQWVNGNYKFRFSKLPIIMCVAISAAYTPMMFAEANNIPSTMEVKSEEEAFLVRRIAEFWKDRDFILVKRQIHDFLEKYPSSPINDQLRGILGDLYLQEKDYQGALSAYGKISDPYIEEKVIVNRLQCYYELNDFASLAKDGKPYLHISSKRIGDRKDELYFLVAEALFRQALDTHDQTMKEDLAAQARPLYEEIKDTSFNKHSKLALAEIYNVLKDYEKAAGYYLEIASAYPDQSEELLSQAALSQAEYDPQLAIHTFSQLADMKGAKANEAAINRLILYFQEEEFDNVIKFYPEIIVSMGDEKKPTIDYIVGRSYFALHDYKNSSDFLNRYIDSQATPSPHLKNALLMQLNCTQQNGHDDLCDKTIARFKQHFMDDAELNQALFIHAMMLKGRGDLLGAEEELATIMKDSQFEDKEALYLEYGLVCHENEKWSDSYNTLKTYISIFQEGEHKNVAWKYFLSASLNRLKSIETDSAYSKGQFYDDIALVLNEQSTSKEILSPEEERDCRLLSSKTAYELKRYSIAAAQLNAYIKDYPSDQNVGEAHLILGICHQNLDSDPELFYSNIEKALAMNPGLSDQSTLHLQLYNAYLAKIELMAQTTAKDNLNPVSKEALYDLAAEHLYKAVQLNNSKIKGENKLWLANHYYTKFKQEDKANPNMEFVKRSYELYRPMLTKTGNKLVVLNEESLFLEAEVLKFTELLDLRSENEMKMQLLKQLAEQQTRNNSLNWNYQLQTLLELAQSYEGMQDQESALDTYVFIQNASRGVPSFINDFATLHASRLKFNLMDNDFRNEKNEQILGMLNHLKDLQIKKSPSSEPLHLEAALEYAHIRANICDSNEKDDRYLFFLGRLKDDYLAEDDAMTRDYHSKLAKSEGKQAVYNAYMAYVEAEMLRSKAKIEHKKNRLAVAEELNSKALSKLAEVKNSDAITPYLNEKVQASIRNINTLNRS